VRPTRDTCGGRAYLDQFADLLAVVFDFADPVVTDGVGDATWRPDRRVWL
jgi:hypothetical protein